MADSTLVSDFEERVALAVEMMVGDYQQKLAALGGRPFGWTRGNKWDLAESYLEVRDDPTAWAQMLSAYTLQVGELAAVTKLVKDATDMEKMLVREGQWDGTQADYDRAANAGALVVRGQQALRRLSLAQRGQRLAEAEMAKPQAWVSGPLSVPQEQQLVMGTPPVDFGQQQPMPPPAPFGPPQQIPQPPMGGMAA